MEKCAKCGKEFELSKEDKGLRRNIEWTVKIAGGAIESIAPGLKEAILDSKGCCNTCYHQATDTYTQAIQAALGKKSVSSPGPEKIV